MDPRCFAIYDRWLVCIVHLQLTETKNVIWWSQNKGGWHRGWCGTAATPVVIQPVTGPPLLFLHQDPPTASTPSRHPKHQNSRCLSSPIPQRLRPSLIRLSAMDRQHEATSADEQPVEHEEGDLDGVRPLYEEPEVAEVDQCPSL